ncbi:hypothetical protein EPA93_23245 [Ktedonosporobacter rubrisoli]|uniref:Uncharacterized protein n=1 Tax=Ktedonosporobacter rubrisoli TaxID=2509675 RepID=A0A4P6JTV6_KTERU|nr:hypothetical protein [Ktedonosporobacter rubrisoli]QBD78740.1 hypothetical protein EPA93_23245 [Ktedonosporobacter rubrisoli]
MGDGRGSKVLPIRLELRPSQRHLFQQLKNLFPALEPDMRNIEQNSYCYFAAIDLAAPGLAQAAFLQQHQIHYTDLHKEREELIQASFQGIEINGVLIQAVTCATDSQGQVIAYLEGKERDARALPAAPYWQGEESGEHIFIVNFPANWYLKGVR